LLTCFNERKGSAIQKPHDEIIGEQYEKTSAIGRPPKQRSEIREKSLVFFRNEEQHINNYFSKSFSKLRKTAVEKKEKTFDTVFPSSG
jgi:hypothetical protein